MRKIKNKSQKKSIFSKIIVTILFVLVIIITSMIILDLMISPVLREFAEEQAKVQGINVIESAILEQVRKEPELYQNLTTVTSDENGNITGISVDSYKLAKIKSGLSKAANDALNSQANQIISVPIGNIIGFQITQGRGSNFDFQIIPATYVESEFKSEFTNVGINQTKYRLLINFNAKVTAFIPGFTSYTEIDSDICIAENIIVGDVPKVYLQ